MADYTWSSVIWMYSLMVMFGAGTVFFLVKAIRSGAVAADEAPKYRMLEDDDPPAACRAAGARGGNHARSE
jgi:hypothetical protein